MKFIVAFIISTMVLCLFIIPLIACTNISTTNDNSENTQVYTGNTPDTINTTTSPEEASVTATYSPYTIVTSINENFTISIGAAFPGYTWVADYEKTKFEKIGESVFSESQLAQANPFNNIGTEVFTFKALKEGKTQINLVHRPITDEGTLDYAEMGLWQELFTIIVD